jgi:hypothetical protein
VPHNNPGPQMPADRDRPIPGEWVVATEIGELASRNPAASHRRPGAQKKATAENGQPRNIAELGG